MEHTIVVRVRHHEMDALGHVNNAVYLNYVEEAAIEHGRARGYDEARWRSLGGNWVVRRHEIDYKAPAVAGDELRVTTRIVSLDRTRGTRRTMIERDGALLVEAATEWVWVDFEGRPRRIPPEVLADFTETEKGRPEGRP
jgi:acyl-CoA thioester hydrolase